MSKKIKALLVLGLTLLIALHSSFYSQASDYQEKLMFKSQSHISLCSTGLTGYLAVALTPHNNITEVEEIKNWVLNCPSELLKDQNYIELKDKKEDWEFYSKISFLGYLLFFLIVMFYIIFEKDYFISPSPSLSPPPKTVSSTQNESIQKLLFLSPVW